MKSLLYPRSILVVGASAREGNLGRNIINNLRSVGFTGRIRAIGRGGGVVQGVAIQSSLEELTESFDLATVLVPAKMVPGVVEACGRRGIPYIHVGSGGFDEFSDEGRTLAREMKTSARMHNVRILGPNCLGVLCPRGGTSTSFGTMRPVREGCVSIVSQSGGVGISLLQMLTSAGVGISVWVSLGNKVDLDEVDFLKYVSQDEHTRVALFYLEGFKRPKAFFEAAGQANKPIVLFCSNLSEASAETARTHTAAMMTDGDAVAAACRKSGVLLTRDIRQAVAATKALAMPPLQGDRLAVLSRSGGHAVIAADRCAALGFECPTLPGEVLTAVENGLRAGVMKPGNPMDLGDLFDTDVYRKLLRSVMESDGVDGVVLLHVGRVGTEQDSSGILLSDCWELSEACSKPIAFVSMHWREQRDDLMQAVPHPLFDTIEEALDGMDWSRRYGRLVTAEILQAAERPFTLEPAVLARLGSVLALKKSILASDAAAVLVAAGVPMVPWETARDPESAVQAARRVGFPCVVKLLSPAAVHKSDVGGVATGLASRDAVRDAARRMLERFKTSHPCVSGLLVQPHVEGGIEMVVGARRVAELGVVVLVGVGGTWVEVFREFQTAMAPLTRQEAEALIEQARFRPLLDGARGQPPADVAALADVVIRVAALVYGHNLIQQLEINPLRVMPVGKGCVGLDARIVTAQVSFSADVTQEFPLYEDII